MPFLKGKDIKLAFNEWSPGFRNATPVPGNARPGGGMIGPLSIALTYHEFFRNSDLVAMGVNTAGMMQMVTDRTGDAVRFRGKGLIMKVLHDLLRPCRWRFQATPPQYPVKGTVGVDTSQLPSGSPTYPLDMAAAITPDHAKLVILVVNPTESAQPAELKLSGVKTEAQIRLWQSAVPDVNAVNLPGQKPAVELLERSVPQIPGRFTLPPMSVSAYEFTWK